ncbi:DUF1656 domain-containing protein [Chromobacterium piscinae]|uniref:DUF1656 domain-containing protein n=1 Tax=Chromobacterium piscinae TaxID=686831 RepID=A0ABV0HCS3_9NEIS
MIGEVNFYGVYFPSLLVMMVIAFAASSLLRHALARLGLYRVVWHRSLFNFALYVIVLGGTIALFHR